MTPIRVLIVEDSLTIRKRLREVLESNPEFEVIAEAADGKQAIELCAQLRPDVMSLDMMLPVMTGVAATEYIMAHCPTPILIVSSSTNRGELFKTYDALAAGAVDVLEKPSGDEKDGEWEHRYLSALKLVSRIKVITHPRARLGTLGRVSLTSTVAPTLAPASKASPHVLALGASTGGPGALVDILRSIPRPLPVPTLMVLHIDEPFSLAFAEWLDAQTIHRVSYPQEGDPVAAFAGRVVMAPPGSHLVVRAGRLHLTKDPERHSCRPSVDVLFESLAQEYGPAALACLLTGMGRDGAAGLLTIKNAGGYTIAQDEATSVVYGMPREAALLGAASRVLPLSAIGGVIVELMKLRGSQS
jgi:two-component system chemotaxis response regulator CheB